MTEVLNRWLAFSHVRGPDALLRWQTEVLDLLSEDVSFSHDTLYPVVDGRANRALAPLQQSPWTIAKRLDTGVMSVLPSQRDI